jgi:hypothetical protein
LLIVSSAGQFRMMAVVDLREVGWPFHRRELGVTLIWPEGVPNLGVPFLLAVRE